MTEITTTRLPKSGRVNQKLRTRKELLRGARELMQSGLPVTVAGAAKHVGISTATSYRYFSDPETLMFEAVIEMDLGATGDFVRDLEKIYEYMQDPADRIVEANRMMVEFARHNENSYRLFLAKRHEQFVSEHKSQKALPRSDQNVSVVSFALDPVRAKMSTEDFDDAVLAISAMCGPVPYFGLKDQCALPDSDIDRICEKNLRILVAALFP